MGRLSNPPDLVGAPVAHGFASDRSRRESAAYAQIGVSDGASEHLPEEAGRLSNPSQRRLSPAEIGDLIQAYRAGSSINELAIRYRIHRTTVAGHLDRNHIPRHREQSAWDDGTLSEAAELYATGRSLVDVADRYGIDAQTVANRFRRAGVSIRPRRGWPA